MHWLLQTLDKDDMDTFLSGLPGYLHSPLTDEKLVGFRKKNPFPIPSFGPLDDGPRLVI